MENIGIIGRIILIYIAFLIAFLICAICHIKKENMKSAIGYAITSALLCVLQIIVFIIAEDFLSKAQAFLNFFIFLINFILGIKEIKKNKSE